MTLWNFKHVKLGQILTGYKTGFVRLGHVLELLTALLEYLDLMTDLYNL